jgi:DnaK suppressor protein
MTVILPPDYQPSSKEEFMNDQQREYFSQKLLTWRAELMQETDDTIRQMEETGRQGSDFADQASYETDKAFELRTRDRERKLLSKIELALSRLKDGTYGFCTETGNPIGLKRLEARPIATLSIEAQERHEIREQQGFRG